jgi:serine/threonine protein kinase
VIVNATAQSGHLAPGTILGSYELHEVIGRGGMGVVYRATHIRLGRKVAIKMLRPGLASNPNVVRRFFAEARAVNKIQHPNLVEITDFVEQDGSDNYYVMELLEGRTLAKVLDAQCGSLPLGRAVAIMMQLADVLRAVHAAGIVHRDVKPANIILVSRGGNDDFVKLVDFGCAKLTNSDNDAIVTDDVPIVTGTTNPGSVLGTPDYMSPEQARGRPVDHRTDVYAFGVVLYELVTGRLPIIAPDFGELVVKLLTVTPQRPREVPGLPHEIPESLDKLIMNCLGKRTADRPDSLQTLSTWLGEIADEQGWLVYELSIMPSAPVRQPIAVVPPVSPHEPVTADAEVRDAMVIVLDRSPPRTVAKPPPPRRWPIAIAAGAIALVIAVFVVARTRDSRADDTDAKVRAELSAADARMADGRLVTPNGDDALSHLLAARTLAPSNAAVRERLHSLAITYERLAEQAIAAESLAEAAAHLQVVITAEPDNATAAAKLDAVEARARKGKKVSAPRRADRHP